MELSIKLTEQECGYLKSILEMIRSNDWYTPNSPKTEQVRSAVYRKLLFEMSKIQCPYCEDYSFVVDQAEKLRKCLECGNEFECG